MAANIRKSFWVGLVLCALVSAGAFLPVSSVALQIDSGKTNQAADLHQGHRNEVAFVDCQVLEPAFFVEHLSSRMPVYVLEKSGNALEQMAVILANLPPMDAIHIFDAATEEAIR